MDYSPVLMEWFQAAKQHDVLRHDLYYNLESMQVLETLIFHIASPATNNTPSPAFTNHGAQCTAPQRQVRRLLLQV